jgi:hypothetical protein
MEEDLEAVQSNPTSESVFLLRLDAGHASRPKAVPLEQLNHQTEGLRAAAVIAPNTISTILAAVRARWFIV